MGQIFLRFLIACICWFVHNLFDHFRSGRTHSPYRNYPHPHFHFHSHPHPLTPTLAIMSLSPSKLPFDDERWLTIPLEWADRFPLNTPIKSAYGHVS